MANNGTSVGLPLSGGQAVNFDADSEAVSANAVLEFQSPTLTLIAAPAPFTARMTLWLVSTFVLLALVLFATVPLDRTVVAPGVVLAQNPDVIVQPFELAIVRKIYVKEGQVVKKGDVLADLDPTMAVSDKKSTVDQMASLTAQVARLKAELGNTTYFSDGSSYGQLEEMAYLQRHQQFTSTVEQYDQQIKSLQAKVALAKGDIEGFTRRLVGLRGIEDMRKELEKYEVGSKLLTLQAIDTRLQIEQSLSDARNAYDGATKDLAAQIATRDAWIHQWYGDTQQLESQQERTLSDMTAQAKKNTMRSDLVTLKAEADSIILTVARVSPGTVLQSGVQLITTVPVDSKLEVTAPIDGADSGFVSEGQEVEIKFDTLPYFRFGYAVGHIVKLASDSFVDPTAAQSNPATTQPSISTQDPVNLGTAPVYYFRAQISIDRLELKKEPPSFHLMPGMPVEADIRVGGRTIMAYLFDKVLPFFSEGMREPT
jgi:HlyD family secretion protein